LRKAVDIAIQRIRGAFPTKSVLMVGLRGVGKTVLLDRMRRDAEAQGIETLQVEAPEDRSLPAILAPELRQALLRLSRNARAKDLAERALRGLAGFAKALKVKYQDIGTCCRNPKAPKRTTMKYPFRPSRARVEVSHSLASACAGDRAFGDTLVTGFASAR
jgi:hypothetical protein